jgi:hypothetical protein
MGVHARKLTAALAVIATLALAAPAAAFAAYGAIAVDPFTHAWGKSWKYSHRRGAERRALRECRAFDPGTHCQGVIWYKNACGAVFENSAETKFFYAFARSERAAKRKVRARHPRALFITAGCANGRRRE